MRFERKTEKNCAQVMTCIDSAKFFQTRFSGLGAVRFWHSTQKDSSPDLFSTSCATGRSSRQAFDLLDFEIVLKCVDRPDRVAEVKPVESSIDAVVHHAARIDQVLRIEDQSVRREHRDDVLRERLELLLFNLQGIVSFIDVIEQNERRAPLQVAQAPDALLQGCGDERESALRVNGVCSPSALIAVFADARRTEPGVITRDLRRLDQRPDVLKMLAAFVLR